MNEYVIGVDLGTTNSAVAVCRDGRIEILPGEDGIELLPSCVALTPENELLVGEQARNQLVLHPERTVRSIKRKMGTDERVQLGDNEYSPSEISAIILRELKLRAERHLGEAVSKAVITIPAYFSDAQRNATREAGVMAGLEVLRIINEPTAACLAYEPEADDRAGTVMAFDFGGGTFDVSIVNLDKDLVEVIASHGDTHLGGDDIDELIVQRLREELARSTGPGKDLTEIAANRLWRAAEQAKIQLSDRPYARIIEDSIEMTDGTREHLEYELAREELEELIEPLLQKTMASVREALNSAGKTRADIADVLLVGGSTRVSAVPERLRRELGCEPRSSVHPERAVVYGAAVMAGRLMGQDSQRILVDITPYTFGTSAVGMLEGEPSRHLFCPIIKAGTPLPAAKSEVFYTMVDGQARVEVTVFEGEDEDARRNILIGRFMIEGLDPDAEESSPVIVTMTLDLDGILRVTAVEKATGLSKNVVIERALDKLSGEALDASRKEIARLFGEVGGVPQGPGTEGTGTDLPDEEEEGTDALRQARRLLRRLHRAKRDMDDVDREDAELLETKLRTALDEGNQEECERLTIEVEDLLFYVESA